VNPTSGTQASANSSSHSDTSHTPPPLGTPNLRSQIVRLCLS
jgi:hypothetical protein